MLKLAMCRVAMRISEQAEMQCGWNTMVLILMTESAPMTKSAFAKLCAHLD